MAQMDKKKYEYIIGIDLGHGETSAAICPLQWDVPAEQLDPAKDLEMGGNKKVIPSAITILDNGTAYIGDSAFNPEILKQADVHVCFKKAPKDMNGEAEKLMICYMQEVYRRIRENNSAMLTDAITWFILPLRPAGINKHKICICKWQNKQVCLLLD
jgi:molecular chaperone DnaK (HSP70)